MISKVEFTKFSGTNGTELSGLAGENLKPDKKIPPEIAFRRDVSALDSKILLLLVSRLFALKSMLKVSHTRHDHGHAVGVAIVDAVLVFDRSAGLHDCGDSSFVSDLHAVREWEEGV